MKRAKYYVGYKIESRELFKSVDTPTFQSHGHLYAATIGPFRTKRGAEYMRANNLCTHVNMAEKRAKYLSTRHILEKACSDYNDATNPRVLRTSEDHEAQLKRAREAKATIAKGGWKQGEDFIELTNGQLSPLRLGY
jgi:hypothetical protein